MGNVNLVAVFAGAIAFFAVGALWYTVLFGKAWQRASGLTDEQLANANMLKIFGLCFAFELLIALMLGHLIARTSAAPHVVMMMAVGIAVGFMVPAIGINYLYLRKSAAHFFIDAGHFIVGMAAVGAVFVALG